MRGGFLNNAVSLLNKNNNVLFAALSIISLGATIYFVAKGQMKADEILAKRDEYYRKCEEEAPKLTKKEVVKRTWKCFIPAAIATVMTLSSIVIGNYISIKKIAGLSATVGFLVADRNNIEQLARDKLGNEAVDNIKGAVFKKEPKEKVVVKFVPTEVIETGKGGLLCRETFSGRTFRSSEEAVDEAFSNLYEELLRYEIATLSDLYRFFGLDATEFGDMMIWEHSSVASNISEYGVAYSVRKEYDEYFGEEILLITLDDLPYGDHCDF